MILTNSTLNLTENKLRKTAVALAVLTAAILIFAMSAVNALAADIKIYIDGKEIQCDASPYLENDRTFIPMRFAAEPLGAYVGWDESTQTASFIKGDNTVQVIVGSDTAYVNGAAKKLDAAARVRNDRTFVPIRFVSESLNCDCVWQNNAVYITTKNNNNGNNNNNNNNNGSFKYLGYYFTYNALGDLKDYANELTDVSHFAYNLKADGTIEKKTYYQTDKFVSEGQAVAEKAGHNTYMLVTGFSKADLTAVLADENLRKNAVNEIAAELKSRGLDGADIDFESVATDQRANYVAFVKELRQAIGKEKLINISIMPRSSASQTWLDGYDYGGLAEYADTISLMCYNEHYSTGSPGPVASYGWTENVVKYTLSQGVDSKQIILALGSYGYDWAEGGKGTSVYNSSALSTAKSVGSTVYRDPASGCLYYEYTKDDIKHTVWFEDATSLAQKASLAVDYDLGGVGFWKLGNITDSIWASVLQATNHSNADKWLKKAGTAAKYPEKAVN